MDDTKRAYREVEETSKEAWRNRDGEDLADKVGNLGDDIRKDLGNAGDEIREQVDRMTDEGNDPDRRYPADPIETGTPGRRA